MTRSRFLSVGALASASVVTVAALVGPGAAVAAGKGPRLFDRTATPPGWSSGLPGSPRLAALSGSVRR